MNWFQILVYLSKYLQQRGGVNLHTNSCELISNPGIFIKVFTTHTQCSNNSCRLWIDFKSWYIYQSIYNNWDSLRSALTVVNWFQILVYLSKYLQRDIYVLWDCYCCELISNLGIFIKVFTTLHTIGSPFITLWIDFKSWYIYQSIYNVGHCGYPRIKVVSSFQFGIFIKVITTVKNMYIEDL